MSIRCDMSVFRVRLYNGWRVVISRLTDLWDSEALLNKRVARRYPCLDHFGLQKGAFMNCILC